MDTAGCSLMSSLSCSQSNRFDMSMALDIHRRSYVCRCLDGSALHGHLMVLVFIH